MYACISVFRHVDVCRLYKFVHVHLRALLVSAVFTRLRLLRMIFSIDPTATESNRFLSEAIGMRDIFPCDGNGSGHVLPQSANFNSSGRVRSHQIVRLFRSSSSVRRDPRFVSFISYS